MSPSARRRSFAALRTTVLGMTGAVAALGACRDVLVEEPKAFVTTEAFYQTAADLDLAVQSTYASLRAALGVASTGPGWWWALEAASDQARIDATEPNQGTFGPDAYLWTAAQPVSTDVGWQSLFQQIHRANIVIGRAPTVPDVSAAARAGFVAEARFMRAYAYLWLTKVYSAGTRPDDLAVQLLFTEQDHARPDVPRATQQEVLAAVERDLLEAEGTLPAARPAAQRGRATRGAAWMALADLYLWRSSFMLSGEWEKAAAWSRRVIDSGLHALEPGYFDTFLPRNEAGNREMIFALVATGTAGRSTSGFVNAYFPRELGFGTGGGWGVLRPTPWHLASYARGDVRGAVGPQSDTVAYRTSGCSTSGNIGCRTFDPMPWKYRPSSLNNAEGDVDVPLYRYAEALLVHAEALNELGRTAEAIGWVNVVRARARRGTGDERRAQPADLPRTLGRLEAREAIYMEREWELAHEGKRWLDLLRRDSMEPGYWIASLRAHDPETFRLVPDLAARPYKKRWPIPQREIDNDPALKQNPGY